ncbi:hypothetical protein L1887_31216 [Cichorium endivia]|nr:hypothetical protein L1887_31216 [Cichorium endivia]
MEVAVAIKTSFLISSNIYEQNISVAENFNPTLGSNSSFLTIIYSDIFSYSVHIYYFGNLFSNVYVKLVNKWELALYFSFLVKIEEDSITTNQQGAVNFALMMSQMVGGCPVDYNTRTDLFLQLFSTSAPVEDIVDSAPVDVAVPNSGLS